MNPQPLPCLLSIPHGGREIPDDLADQFALDVRGWWFEDADAWTQEIYQVADDVMETVVCDIVRAVCDMNRDEADRPPDNPDGVVKTRSCYGRPVWKNDSFVTDELAERLIAAHHRPYHAALAEALQRPGLRFAFDCHSMAAVGPEISPDAGEVRPMICLGNRDGLTCENTDLRRFGACIASAFEIDTNEISYNDPFAGGLITRRYGEERSPVPWIQVELSRALYLSDPWFNERSMEISPSRIDRLNRAWLRTLQLFFDGR